MDWVGGCVLEVSIQTVRCRPFLSFSETSHLRQLVFLDSTGLLSSLILIRDTPERLHWDTRFHRCPEQVTV